MYSQRAFSTSIQRRNFDVGKALKNVRIFRRPSKNRRTFDVQRRFDVDISTVFYSTSIRRRIKVEILTMPAGLVQTQLGHYLYHPTLSKIFWQNSTQRYYIVFGIVVKVINMFLVLMQKVIWVSNTDGFKPSSCQGRVGGGELGEQIPIGLHAKTQKSDKFKTFISFKICVADN